MMLSKPKFIQVLKNINHLQIYQQRHWDTIYKNKTCKYWNALLYYKLIEDDTIYGISIDFKEFSLYFKTLQDEKIKQLFRFMKNNSGNSIFLNDFEDFLNHLSSTDYNNIMNCLEKDDSLIDIDIDTLSETSNQIVSLGGGDGDGDAGEVNLQNRGGFCFDFLEFYNMTYFLNEINNFIKHILSGCIA